MSCSCAFLHGGGCQNGLHDLVVPGAATEIARQTVANLLLGWLGAALQERLRRDDETWRANPALQSGVLEELLLKWVQILRRCDALDRRDLLALNLDAENEARVDEPAIEHHIARAAVAVVAPFLGPGQMQLITEHLEQALARLAQDVRVSAVDRR